MGQKKPGPKCPNYSNQFKNHIKIHSRKRHKRNYCKWKPFVIFKKIHKTNLLFITHNLSVIICICEIFYFILKKHLLFIAVIYKLSFIFTINSVPAVNLRGKLRIFLAKPSVIPFTWVNSSTVEFLIFSPLRFR